MAVLNKVQLIGHVGQTPKTTQTKENHPVASVSLATNESYRRNGEWESITEWHHLVFFGKLAAFAVERLQKGSLVYIEGKLRSNSWIDAEGVKRQSINIVVLALQLLDNAKAKELPEQTDKPTPEEYLTQMHSMLGSEEVPFLIVLLIPKGVIPSGIAPFKPKENNMNAFEAIAVSTFLSYWHDEIEYSTLIDRLKSDELGNDEDSLTVWHPFEGYPGEFIAECIDILHRQLVNTFDEKPCLKRANQRLS